MRPPTVTPTDSGSMLASSTVHGASEMEKTHIDRAVSDRELSADDLVRALTFVLRKISLQIHT